MKQVKKNLMLLMGVSLLSSIILVSSNCRSSKTQEEKVQTASQTTAYPDTTGTALWAYLQKTDYQKNWKMWPGKTAFYPGTQPHGALLTTYVNDIAYNAIAGKTGTLPDNSIIVKENYKADSTLAAHTVMYKVKNYNPSADDWFWAKIAPNGEIQMAGTAGMCIGCHGQQEANDYIWTASLK